MRQLEHQEINNTPHAFPLCIVCNDITAPDNVGMLFRISEAMGVEHLYLCGNTPSIKHKRVQKTSRSTQNNMAHSQHADAISILEKLKKDGYTLIALEITDQSQSLSEIDFTSFEKIALIPGNEQYGVGQEILDMVDFSVEINMFGKNTSMNIVNSVSIALYEITKQISQ